MSPIRQAIETRVMPATNSRPTRIKASCERGSLVITWNHDLTADENHAEAARCLIAGFVVEDRSKYGTEILKNPWSKPFVSGGLKNSVADVFVP